MNSSRNLLFVHNTYYEKNDLTRVEKLHINGVTLLGRGNDDEIISDRRSLPSTWPKLQSEEKKRAPY